MWVKPFSKYFSLTLELSRGNNDAFVVLSVVNGSHVGIYSVVTRGSGHAVCRQFSWLQFWELELLILYISDVQGVLQLKGKVKFFPQRCMNVIWR